MLTITKTFCCFPPVNDLRVNKARNEMEMTTLRKINGAEMVPLGYRLMVRKTVPFGALSSKIFTKTQGLFKDWRGIQGFQGFFQGCGNPVWLLTPDLLMCHGNLQQIMILPKGVPIFISALAISAYRHFFFQYQHIGYRQTFLVPILPNIKSFHMQISAITNIGVSAYRQKCHICTPLILPEDIS